MSKVYRNKEELKRELNEQIGFLLNDVKMFDSGQRQYAKLMAVRLRVLLHDGHRDSKSLLGQLGLTNNSFLNTGEREPPADLNSFKQSFSSLVGVSGSTFVPHFDDVPGKVRHTPFSEWWHEIVHRDQEGDTFTRQEIVKYLADQDGGAHVDSGLDKRYDNLSRQNSLGWLSNAGDGWKPIDHPEYMTVRQIAHEVLRTLEVPYEPIKPVTNSPLTVSGAGFRVSTRPVDEFGFLIKRKDPCPCGSGKKYKRCHGAAPRPNL